MCLAAPHSQGHTPALSPILGLLVSDLTPKVPLQSPTWEATKGGPGPPSWPAPALVTLTSYT